MPFSRNSAGAFRPAASTTTSKLVGGAALILQGIGNRPTADIDASYADEETVNAVVIEMAADYDLEPHWLNSNAAAFVPDNATWVELEKLDGLTICRLPAGWDHPAAGRDNYLIVVDDAVDAATALDPDD